jgi:hypothetical protein
MAIFRCENALFFRNPHEKQEKNVTGNFFFSHMGVKYGVKNRRAKVDCLLLQKSIKSYFFRKNMLETLKIKYRKPPPSSTWGSENTPVG